jgi:hypothetical protein
MVGSASLSRAVSPACPTGNFAVALVRQFLYCCSEANHPVDAPKTRTAATVVRASRTPLTRRNDLRSRWGVQVGGPEGWRAIASGDAREVKAGVHDCGMAGRG